MMNAFTKTRLRIEEAFSAILLGLLIGFVFVAAVLRWVGISIVWSVDIAQFLFTWLCFVGADLAYYHNKHMGVDLLKNRLQGKARIWLELVLNLLVIVFVASILYFGLKLSVSNYVRKFNSLPLSYSWTTIAASIGSLLMLFTGAEKLVNHIRALRSREIPGEQQQGGEKR